MSSRKIGSYLFVKPSCGIDRSGTDCVYCQSDSFIDKESPRPVSRFFSQFQEVFKDALLGSLTASIFLKAEAADAVL